MAVVRINIWSSMSYHGKLQSIGGHCTLYMLLFSLFPLPFGNLTQFKCNELGGYMARFTQFPIMITRSTIIYDIISPGAAGSSIYV